MLGIIPHSPSPIPLEDRPIEQLSVQELHELVRRQRDQLLQNAKEEDKTKPVVKCEARNQINGQDVLDDDGSSDLEVAEVVSKKRKIEVVELSDEE